MRHLVITLISTCLIGCAGSIHQPEIPAATDTLTTVYALAHGARETNPLGFGGATLAKIIYLAKFRPPESAPQARADADRLVSSVWWGATINNLAVITCAPHLAVSLAIGAVGGWIIYNIKPNAEETK